MIYGEYFIEYNKPPIEELIIQPNSQAQLRQSDLRIAQATLVHELEKQLTSTDEVQEQINSLESRLFDVETQQFSPTVTLSGEVIFGISKVSSRNVDESAVFGGSVELIFNASFTGEDSLEIGLESGNFTDFSYTGELTNEGRLGFLTDTDNLELSELSYEFPVGDRASIYISTKGDDLSDLNPFLESRNGKSGSGAISEFGTENPIHNLVQDVGLQLNYDLTEALNISLGYFSEEADNSESVRGLFNSNYSAFVQLEFEPNDNLLLGFTYIHSYNESSLETDTGSIRSQVNLERPVVGNSYGIGASWLLNSHIALSAWVGFTKANVIDLGKADIWNYALTLIFPDLGREGNLLGLIIGQEPKLTGTSGFTIDERQRDPDTLLHIETFYKYQVNDNLSITPGLIWITAPNHDNNNADIFLFTIRTTFEF